MDETRKQSARGMVGESLKAAIEILGRLEETAHVRELQTRARGYLGTLATWESKRPSHAELSAMIEHVERLQADVEAVRRGDARAENEG